jgi:predicted alpha/beta-fold hydrolase
MRETHLIMQHLVKQFPNHKFYAIGHSLGANNLAKYLGFHNKDQPFDCAVLVSNPWDFIVASKYLNSISDYYIRHSR